MQAIAVLIVLAFAGLGAGALVVLRRRLTVRVYAWERGLLYVDGRFVRVLDPGPHRRSPLREHLVVRIDCSARFLDVPGVEVTSQDRLPYRIAATLSYAVVDPRVAHEGEYRKALSLAVTDALARLAAGRSLDAVLGDRPALSPAVRALMPDAVRGCRIDAVTVTAITLPPEIRRLASEVERARQEGLAALERARGEQAALRALANAARMLKGNPELAQLRLLHALPAGGQRATLVLGRDALAQAAATGPLAERDASSDQEPP